MNRNRFIKKSTLAALGLFMLCFAPRQDKVTIYSIGDSTMSDYSARYLNNFGEGYPIRGWMQMAPAFFTGNAVIRNCARSGRSSKSFRTEGFWAKVIQQVKPGDYVFIQFGHNDEKPDTARHTEPQTTFKDNLLNYVKEVKAKGANPVLFTSIPRCRFDKNGHIIDTHGEYVSVVRTLAQETGTPLVDLNKKTIQLLEELGPEKSKALFLYIEPGRFPKLPNGKNDNAHLCGPGATKVATLAVEGIKELGLPLKNYIK